MKQIISKQFIANIVHLNNKILYESLISIDFEISPKEFQIFVDRLIQESNDFCQLGGVTQLINGKSLTYSESSILLSSVSIEREKVVRVLFSPIDNRSGNILKEISRHRTDFKINVQLEAVKQNNHFKNLKLLNFNFII